MRKLILIFLLTLLIVYIFLFFNAKNDLSLAAKTLVISNSNIIKVTPSPIPSKAQNNIQTSTSLQNFIQWNTVIISLISSFIVSLTMFIFGLRAGKNQADRQRLKDLYRALSIYFIEIYERIDSTRPKNWYDYESKREFDNYYITLPLVRKMKKEGTLLEINHKLAQCLEQCEYDSMCHGYKHKNLTKQIKDITENLVKEYCPNVICENKYSISTGKLSHYGLSVFSFGVFLKESGIKQIIDALIEKPDNVLEFEYQDDDHYSVKIFPNTLQNITRDEFVNLLYKEILKIKEIPELLSERELLKKRLKKVIRVLERRVREPHSVLETITTAITDIFKV